MKSWSRKSHKARSAAASTGSDGSDGSSALNPPPPVWVTHTPVPDVASDDGDATSVGHASTSRPSDRGVEERKGSAKDRIRALIPRSWGSVFRKQASEAPSPIQILPNGTRVSPPVSPLLGRRDACGSPDHSSQNSHKPLLGYDFPDDEFGSVPPEDSFLTSVHPAEYYAEKLEVYNLKYSYLKSWPGLLRLLAGLELLFGGMVFVCIIAYIQKDSEWSNVYGQYNGAYNNGYGLSGYSYGGPMTPFVLAVAGLSWVLTLVLLVLGMTMYYRTILLDSPWWPLAEASINVALFLLYMAAGIVYLNDLSRGGLCYMTVGVNPILSSLCRVEGGQMAGTAFIFIVMVMYLGSFLVCLKMWRHEATRRERAYFESRSQEEFQGSIPLTTQKTKSISFRDETDDLRHVVDDHAEARMDPVRMNRTSGRPSKVHVVADYVIKYPEVRCVEVREKYAAVFNDQYQEYKDLHQDIISTLSRFRELDLMMLQLLRTGKSPQEQQRIQSLLRTYEEKKSDPSFLEKKERCDYLKAKLSHIKNRIRTFDQETMETARPERKR